MAEVQGGALYVGLQSPRARFSCHASVDRLQARFSPKADARTLGHVYQQPGHRVVRATTVMRPEYSRFCLTTGCRRRWAGWEVLGRRVGRAPSAPEADR